MADLLIADHSALGAGEGEPGASQPSRPVRAIDGAVFGEAWKIMPVVKNADEQMSECFLLGRDRPFGSAHCGVLPRAGTEPSDFVSTINALFRGDDELARLNELIICSGAVAMSCRSPSIPA